MGGRPGVGKSTLILQMCEYISNNGKVLYVSGEESAVQVKLRGNRLKTKSKNILFLNETDIDTIESNLDDVIFLVIDSIQTMKDASLSSSSGSISQIKQVTDKLITIAKGKNITTLVVGHVTKDGIIAGPKLLEHMVDTVIYIEGDDVSSTRIIRTVKNRFGSTNEIALFSLSDNGISELNNNDELFTTDSKLSGSAITCVSDGNLIFPIEIQSLTSHSYYNYPKRVTSSIDLNRLNMIVAVIEKLGNISLRNF
ncbi:MAG: AAA family ATPase [Clostridia bacterium]